RRIVPVYPSSYAVSVSCFKLVFPNARIGKTNGESCGIGASALRFTLLRMLVLMLLLMNDGARNARLNDTRNVFAASGLIIKVVRGEKTAFLIEENLSTRPPTTHRR